MQLAYDPPDDVTAAIVEAYTALESEVPAAIADDFATVLAALRSGATTSATSPAPAGSPTTQAAGSIDEIVTGDTATERLNDFVDFTCRDNPDATATVPGRAPVGPTSPAERWIGDRRSVLGGQGRSGFVVLVGGLRQGLTGLHHQRQPDPVVATGRLASCQDVRMK